MDKIKHDELTSEEKKEKIAAESKKWAHFLYSIYKGSKAKKQNHDV